MKNSPEKLEKLIHETLRDLPDRRAPHTLEARVLAAIEARASLPWWKQSFAHWPLAARGAFIVVSAGLVQLALMATGWISGGFETSETVKTFTQHFAWIDAVRGALRGTGESFALLLRNLPSLWLYGAIACVAASYAVLFSLGATAYRAFASPRSAFSS